MTTESSVPGRDTAWALTQRMSPSPVVQATPIDAYGVPVTTSFSRPWGVSNSHPPVGQWALRLADGNGVYWYLAFDFDGNDDATFDQVDAFVRVLDECGIRYVVCRSSSRDRRHVWVGMDRAGAGAPAAVVAAIGATAHDLYPVLDWGMLSNPATGAVRPPLSPHRDGSASTPLIGELSTLERPSTSTDQILQLRDRLRELAPPLQPLAPATATTSTTERAAATGKRLSWQGQEWLREPGGGADPSRNGYLCLLAMAAAGWDLGDVAQAAAAAPGMEHYRTANDGRGGRVQRPARQAQKRLADQWAKAQLRAARFVHAPPAEDPRTRTRLAEFDALLADVEAVLTSFRVSPGRWGGREAPVTVRSVLAAMAWLVLHSGQRQIAAPVRTVALLAGVSERTARNGLAWLAGHGYLTRVRGAAGEKAAEWRLGNVTDFSTAVDRKYPHLKKIPRPPAELHAVRSSALEALDLELDAAQQDLFAHAGLGQLAARAYALLKTSPASVEHLATLLGVSVRRAGRVLARLRKVGVLAREGVRWRRRKRVRLQAIAQRLGAAGIVEARRGRFERDRVQWQIWLANLDVMSTPQRARPAPVRSSSGVRFGPAIEWFELDGRTFPFVPRLAGARSRADLVELRWWIDEGYVPTPLPQAPAMIRVAA